MKKIILNVVKILLSIIMLFIYIYLVKLNYNKDIWVYKAFVLLMIFILILYFIFKLLKIIFPIKKEVTAKIVDIKEENNLVKITYQYLDNKYYYQIDFYEYDQNKYFKYTLNKWYLLIVLNNRVIELLDPTNDVVIDNKIIEKNYYKSLKYGIHIYMYYLYELLFLINIILFPLILVIENYKINVVLFILIEFINIVLFVVNSKILKR